MRNVALPSKMIAFLFGCDALLVYNNRFYQYKKTWLFFLQYYDDYIITFKFFCLFWSRTMMIIGNNGRSK